MKYRINTLDPGTGQIRSENLDIEDIFYKDGMFCIRGYDEAGTICNRKTKMLTSITRFDISETEDNILKDMVGDATRMCMYEGAMGTMRSSDVLRKKEQYEKEYHQITGKEFES